MDLVVVEMAPSGQRGITVDDMAPSGKYGITADETRLHLEMWHYFSHYMMHLFWPLYGASGQNLITVFVTHPSHRTLLQL